MIYVVLILFLPCTFAAYVAWMQILSNRKSKNIFDRKQNSLRVLGLIGSKVAKTRDDFYVNPKNVDPFVFDVYLFEIRGVIDLMGETSSFKRQINIAEHVKNQLIEMIRGEVQVDGRSPATTRYFYSMSLSHLFTIVNRIEKRIDL